MQTILIILTLCATLWTATVHAQTPARPVPDAVRKEAASAQHLLADQGPQPLFRLAVAEDVRDVSALIELIRASNGVPAIACAVVRSNRLVALGASGVRKAGTTNAPVTLADKWHHGSLTKAMTATLAARLVEQGRIRWDSTLAEVFPELASAMDPAWRTVTLDWLCSHRGGVPAELTAGGTWGQVWRFKGTSREGRRWLLQRLTASPPASKPGTRYEYSNAGFALAGHMLETVMDQPWEELMREHVFRPLGMASAGFGPPATPGQVDQPWGHTWGGGKAAPVEPGPAADNPPTMAPAGAVHCSMSDLARFVVFHLAGHRADLPLLPRVAFRKLHTALPSNDNYAYGWLVLPRPWAKGDALHHAGSNTQWYSVIWMAPHRDFGVVVSCNVASRSGPNPGASVTDQVAGRMIREFLMP